MSTKPPSNTRPPHLRGREKNKLRRPQLRALRDPFDAAAVRTYVPGAWPKIGGNADIGPMPVWNDKAVRARYTPHIRVAVRVLACSGQSAMSRDLQLPIYKVTTTCDTSERCDTRLAQLNRDCYGATILDGVNWRTEDGWSRWMIVPLPAIAGLSPHSPVTVHARGLDVLLPRQLSPEEFDNALTEALGLARLDLFLYSDVGRNHLSALELDRTRFERYTSYNVGRQHPRRSRATELVIYKPRLHAARLVGLIERLVYDAIVKAAAA